MNDRLVSGGGVDGHASSLAPRLLTPARVKDRGMRNVKPVLKPGLPLTKRFERMT